MEFGKDVTLDELLERYDAVLFATGAVEDKPLGLPGADLDGVYGAAKFVDGTTVIRPALANGRLKLRKSP